MLSHINGTRRFAAISSVNSHKKVFADCQTIFSQQVSHSTAFSRSNLRKTTNPALSGQKAGFCKKEGGYSTSL